MVELFIIADDFTGALDTACQFGKHGIPTVVFSGRKMPSLPEEIRVAVVNTDTRHKSPPEARAIVSELAEVCRIQGFPRILKKIDSALRGNWGTELEALLWAGLSDRAYLLPAFPDGGRITQQGIQWLNGVEIAKTAYGRDPFNPVLSSRLSDHLSEKWLQISEGEPLADAPGIQIVDASRSSQLEARCRELPRHGTLILAGCAGLAAALAGEMAQGMESCAAPVPPSERLLIVSGSLHPLSRSQTRWAVQRGIPLITLSPESVGAVSDAFRSSRTVILETSGQLDSSREPEYAARQLAQAVQQIYHKEGPLTLAVFGGDTLLQIVPPIFREGLYPTDEISPGIPVSVAWDRTGQPVTLISKSGGFGPEDVIGQIINYVFSDNLGGNDMEQRMSGIYKAEQAPGAEFRRDLPIPQMGENDLLIQVCAAAICGTDHHINHWDPWAQARVPVPMVFGHELSGDVVTVGKNVQAFAPGDRVAVETHIPCEHCYQCRTGNQHNCENMQIIGVHVPGGFSDYAVIPQSCAWKLDDSISYRHGAMLEPMGVAVHGVFSGEVSLKKVVILGCGPIGIMAVGAACAGGAAGILAVDRHEDKLAMAQKLGAQRVVHTRQEDPVQAILDWTDGRGADVIIDFTGNTELIEASFAALAKGGRYTLVGLPSKKLSLDLTNAVIYKEARINGVTGRLMYETWYQCTEILKKGTFRFDDVIGGIYDMEDFEQAFADIAAGKPGKMLLMTPYGRRKEQEETL